MTVITGNIRDIGMDPLSGTLVATAVEFRTSGEFVVAPESRSFPVSSGFVEADLLPGPARLTIVAGSHARGEFDVIVPDVGPVSLASLVEEAFPWEPEQVSEFVRLRDEAVAAADRAEAAAGDVDSAIAGAADQVVAAVEGDRVAAEAAALAADGSASAAAGSASAASSSASDAAGSATAAGSSATAAAGSASDADASAIAAAGSASAASGHAGTATTQAGVAEGHAQSAASSASSAATDAGRAETAANSFGLTATTTTGAPGTNAAVTVSGDGPAYTLGFTVPQGAKGDDGEVSQAALDAAVASLVDNAPEALDTLSELATALGNDPNFATTVSTEIGKRALIDGAPAEYNSLGKLVSALIGGEFGGGGAEGIAVGEGDGSETAPTAGPFGVAIGWDATAGANTTAIGRNANSAGDSAAAIGGDSNAAGFGSVAIGYSANATGGFSAAIGAGSAVGDDWTIAIGADPAVAGQTHHVTIPGTLDVVGGITVDGEPISDGEVSWPDVTDKPATFPPTSHKHTVSDLTATGTASSTTYLRGDGEWATPANTTYSTMSQAEAENSASTTARLATGQRLHQAVAANPRLSAAPATWRWNGTTLPTSASQVHAQARAGDFIVAPNLTTDPGWHQITGV